MKLRMLLGSQQFFLPHRQVIEGMSSSWSRADTALVGDVKARGFGDLRRH